MSALLDSRLDAERLADALAHDTPPQPSRVDMLAQEVGCLTQQLDAMRRQYEGKGAIPQFGCRIAKVSLEDASVLVEYEYHRAEAPNYDADSRGAGPGCPAGATVVSALINGKFIDPHGFIADEVIERWEEQLCEEASS